MNIEIHHEKTGLLVIDFQEKLAKAMPQDVLGEAVRNTQNIMYLAHQMGMPTIITEQYPRGLGPTIDALSEWTQNALGKTHFSAWKDTDIRQALMSVDRERWIIVGMETHICVYQSARDLIKEGFNVWIPSDAVVSRRSADRASGLALMRDCGAHLSCTEAILFDCLKEARGDVFKEISRRIR